MIVLHTSCSDPLRLDDQFGCVQVAGFTNDHGHTLTSPTTSCDVPEYDAGCDACADKARLRQLR